MKTAELVLTYYYYTISMSVCKGTRMGVLSVDLCNIDFDLLTFIDFGLLPIYKSGFSS